MFLSSTDSERPQIFNCPSDVTAFISTGSPSTTITWTEPTATDNDAIASLVSNYETPASLSAGVYSVLYVAKDPSGNTAECAFQITIIGKMDIGDFRINFMRPTSKVFSGVLSFVSVHTDKDSLFI